MTPAERLLAAADLLDKRAQEATEGPWILGWHRDGHAVGIDANDGETDVVSDIQMGLGDARYIATMHPEVGKAVAGLLRSGADWVKRGEGRAFGGGDLSRPAPDLVALADLILAGESQ